ncbi:MAG TPA: YHS domain-containing protein [Bacteroidia bacterium]|jgi:YHS domain-containing protein|nr:YHS domain-containing protein [Bacteroidia bacterium]
MKINLFKKNVLLICVILSCKLVAQSDTKNVFFDPVSGMKVDKSESYDLIYADKKYYFNSYDSRAVFKMNPQKFLLNQCTLNMITTDLVCGMKVSKAESYDLKYKGRNYYFDSYECKETFKMNPEKFLKNNCVPKDSIK